MTYINANPSSFGGVGASTEATQLLVKGNLDNIKTLITSTNTKLDTVNTTISTSSKPEYVNAFLPVLLDFSSTAIVAAAYTQVIASTAAKAIVWQFSNTSSSTLKLATGAALSEVVFCIIPPGGGVEIEDTFPIATRISVTSDENVILGKLSVVGLV